MTEKTQPTVQKRLRQLRASRKLHLRPIIDIEVLLHADAMLKASERAMTIRVARRFRPKWVAIVYNLLVLEMVHTQAQLDAWFAETLREDTGKAA